MGAVDKVSMPAPTGADQYVIRNTEIAPKSGHWVAHFRRGADNVLFYYDSCSEPYTKYFADGAQTRQSDPSDGEQQSKWLGDAVEEQNCGILALTWLCLVKKHGIRTAMYV